MFLENGKSIVKQRLALFEDIAKRNYQYASVNKTRSSLQNLLDIDEGLSLYNSNEIEEPFDSPQTPNLIDSPNIFEDNAKKEEPKNQFSPIWEKNESTVFKKAKINEISVAER